MSTYASSNWRDASTSWSGVIAAATEAARSAAREFGPQDRPAGHGRRRSHDDDTQHTGGPVHEEGTEGERRRRHDRGHEQRHHHGRRHRDDRPFGFDRSADGPDFPFGPGSLFGPPVGPGFGHGFGGPGFGPPGGPWRARGRGRGRGARRRGDVRAAILVLLDEQPRHGYELISEISERSGGVWRPSPGTVYPTLSQLEDEGLIQVERLDGRKTATLTDEGRAYVEENRAQLGTPWTDVAGDVRAENRTLAGVIAQVGIAASTVALHGTPAQATRAAEILEQTRQELYGVMAEPKTPEKGTAAAANDESLGSPSEGAPTEESPTEESPTG